MTPEYLPDNQKRLLFTAISREIKFCEENNYPDLVRELKSLKYKFEYDKIFKEVYNKGVEDKWHYIKNNDYPPVGVQILLYCMSTHYVLGKYIMTMNYEEKDGLVEKYSFISDDAYHEPVPLCNIIKWRYLE